MDRRPCRAFNNSRIKNQPATGGQRGLAIGSGSVARDSTAQYLETTLLTPVRITIIYILFGSLWILFSDATLHALVTDPEVASRLQTVKGWFYVLVTGALVFWLTRVLSASLETENRERQRAEAELREALEGAEQASRAKTEFLATMSHEFRTPLNAILGFSDILRAQYMGPLGSPKYTEYVNDIYQSGAIMLALVNDILDIAEIEAGKRPIHRIEIALKPLADICLKSFQPQAEEKAITLTLDIADDALRLYADQICVIQIISNLVANAIKYTAKGGAVTLAAAPAPDGGTTKWSPIPITRATARAWAWASSSPWSILMAVSSTSTAPSISAQP